MPVTILSLEGNIDYRLKLQSSIRALREFIDFGPKETKEGELITIRKQKKSPRLKAPENFE